MIRRLVLRSAALIVGVLLLPDAPARADSWQLWIHTPQGVTKFNTEAVDSVTFQFGDFTRPAPVYLIAYNPGLSSMDLTWTATGDDSLTGTAASYDLRYSHDAATPFASMNQATGEPAPQASGATENFTVSGLVQGTTYYFVLRVVDDAGNESLSNQATFTTQGLAPLYISQVYSRGGNTGEPWRNDFVELHNAGPLPINVGGWSVQYATTGAWAAVPISGTIQPGKFYLVQMGSGGTAGALLPTPDASMVISMNNSQGKVAIVTDTTPIGSFCPGFGFTDLMGYGAFVDCYLGSPAAATTATNALKRALNGCQQTYDNSADFSLGTPTPRNSASPAVVCP